MSITGRKGFSVSYCPGAGLSDGLNDYREAFPNLNY